jgi:hypothetical protein
MLDSCIFAYNKNFCDMGGPGSGGASVSLRAESNMKSDDFANMLGSGRAATEGDASRYKVFTIEYLVKNLLALGGEHGESRVR